MQLKDDFSYQHAYWDNYRRFYREQGGFVWFDTKELIVTSRYFKPVARHPYPEFNLTVVSTADHNCPMFKTPEGKPIPKSHLTVGGGQTLLIDLDTSRVVRLEIAESWRWQRETDRVGPEVAPWARPIPTALRKRACAYFPGPGEPPVGAPVSIEQPKALTKDEREHIRALQAASAAWYVLTEVKPLSHWRKNIPCSMDTLLKAKDFESLSEVDRINLHRHGIKTSLEKIEQAYLVLA